MPRYKNSEKHIMISCEADQEYSEAVGVIATRFGLTKGQLVRMAIDDFINGDSIDEMQEQLAFLDARVGQKLRERYTR